ncbi:Ger(x)C family spore germination protein [Paenibacillus sambharensis]|uniref:Ger(X)C family spore germination protein n=1 Tax=Paenibacillus sambharensis TaxID=1803190 RepID=A0A2W1L2I2_9BACL|nr:Ger(x)C family spore germination protein [Paenibacillus sambharensis]PZD94188.1 Ger(x)C family spore germination protein [Paenibacillus sambharensis]
MIRRLVLLPVLILSLLCQTGCWDRREVNEMSVVTGMAIDAGEIKKYKLTVEVINSPELNQKKGGTAAPAIVYWREGDTIAELAQKMNTGMTRELIFSHMRLLVISLDVAREGLFDFFDYMERSREVRNDFEIVLARKSSAADVLQITYPVQKVPSMKLNTQMQTLKEEWGGDPDIRLEDMVISLMSPGREPIMSIVRIRGSSEQGKSTGNMEKVSPDAFVFVDGLGVFREDKYVGSLPVEDIPYVLLADNKLKQTVISAACKEGVKEKFTVDLKETGAKIKMSVKNDIPQIELSVEVEGQLDGTECPDDLSKKNIYQSYESRIETVLAQRLKSVIERVQSKYGSDIFGFGEEMNRQHHSYFKKVKGRWNVLFSKAAVSVKVNAKLRRAGLVTNTFKAVQKKEG